LAELKLDISLLRVAANLEKVGNRHIACRQDGDRERRACECSDAPAQSDARYDAPRGHFQERGFLEFGFDGAQTDAREQDDPGKCRHRVNECRAREANEKGGGAERLHPACVTEPADPARRVQRHRHECGKPE
jgi:hypothetical protein